jgi:hypothetical protein
MTRTGQAAIDAANAHVGHDMPQGAGYCLQFTRECFDVGPVHASAIDAWHASITPHPGDRAVPPAVPAYFDSNSPHEHVCISTEAGTYVSTFNAEVRKYSSLGAVEQAFGRFLGWAEDINGVRVYDPDDDEEDWMSYLSYDEQRRVLAWADQGQPQLGQIRSLVDQIKPNTDRLPIVHANSDQTLAVVGQNHNGIVSILDTLSAISSPSGRALMVAFLVVLIAAVIGVIVGILVAVQAGAWTAAGLLTVGLLGVFVRAARR